MDNTRTVKNLRAFIIVLMLFSIFITRTRSDLSSKTTLYISLVLAAASLTAFIVLQLKSKAIKKGQMLLVSFSFATTVLVTLYFIFVEK